MPLMKPPTKPTSTPSPGVTPKGKKVIALMEAMIAQHPPEEHAGIRKELATLLRQKYQPQGPRWPQETTPSAASSDPSGARPAVRKPLDPELEEFGNRLTNEGIANLNRKVLAKRV
jgi:hypothetical protein